MQNILTAPTLVLILMSAAGYVMATAGMKAAATAWHSAATGMVVIGLTVAVIAEIILLRQASLAIVYVLILAAETVLVMVLAHTYGEGLTFVQGCGAALVIAGLCLVMS
ncbi:hypothetical protein ATO6_18235 [Oceanicola sp. 22II-s10i]|uniref:5-aminolevulinate synthase n=1 Tax=Oceanicola sp. 22II-s10i TaxID=1317116 RepID=UPI000B522C48|nr:5-aminolevulinate synthase [Oceanicola sp. 22II-s10i]OWU83397.1 hypothetical protein ATO6_18235 [Oceanicola sp. 22II-s10i]